MHWQHNAKHPAEQIQLPIRFQECTRNTGIWSRVQRENIWERSFANELVQLAQGIREVKETNTEMFIPKSKVPKDKKVTYGKRVCEMNPEKEEKERTRLTVGENLLYFTGNISAPQNQSPQKSVSLTVWSQPQETSVYWRTSNISISTTSYQTLSLCGFLLKSSHRRSSTLVTSRHWLMTKGGSTCASRRACMSSNNPGSSLTNNW